MQNFAAMLLWVYIVLLIVGGLIGYFKANSKVSLITSSVSAAVLVLCALDIVFRPYMADVVMAVLLIVFAIRLTKTKKFMPSGLMLVLTVVTLALRQFKF
jgi:uncharacterized membrane protein (UPF0136 family)